MLRESYKTSNITKKIRKIKTKYYKRFRPKTPHGRMEGRTDRLTDKWGKTNIVRRNIRNKTYIDEKNKIKTKNKIILIKVIKIK